MLIIVSSITRFKSGEFDYRNSDATWHALYTIQCYNETPVASHLFLPIVSMGGGDNKWISWGACIPDANGNFYYTSFSPAGYFIPWLFLKMTKLPLTEKSLYIFNNILFAISAVILAVLLQHVYKREIIVINGTVAYMFVPELLHGMGIVYWHQSIMQVTLLIQILMYHIYAIEKKNKYKYFFYALTILNPYIEWSGYVANIGFAIAEIIINRDRQIKKALLICLLTALSFGLFSFHYLLRTEPHDFFTALKNRFMARNITTSVLFTDVIGGYFRSFLYLWLALLMLVTWCIIKHGYIKIENNILFLVTAFPILENIIMKQHALAYTYDRMKAIFIVVLILCEIQKNILHKTANRKNAIVVTCVIAAASVLNFCSYINSNSYIWKTDYKNNNSMYANYVIENYPDAVYASDTAIRGYMNLLFKQGIYEGQNLDRATNIAVRKGKSRVVFIKKFGYKLTQIIIKNIETGLTTELNRTNETISEIPVGDFYRASELTDNNWTSGISNTSNIVLFNRENNLLIKLLTSTNLVVDSTYFDILEIDFDDLWIRVKTDKNCSICKYPALIAIKNE